MKALLIGLLAMASGTAHLASAQTSDVAKLVAGLNDTNPLVRMRSFGSMQRRHAFVASPALGRALLRELVSENAVIYGTLEQSNGSISVSDKYGEEFGEYVADLSVTCLRLCDKSNPETIRALASGPFVTADAIATELATNHAAQVAPIFIADSRAGKFGRQIQAIEMLGRLARSGKGINRTQLLVVDSALLAAIRSNSSILPRIAIPAAASVIRDSHNIDGRRLASYHRAVSDATTSKHTPIRTAAAEALAVFHDPADRALLNHLATSDSARTTSRGMVLFPVREAAAKSLRYLPPV